MSDLQFAKTRNQALLALVVQEASELARKNATYLGRTALQKIVYFLKRSGAPIEYNFDIYHYGPYSDPLYDDIEWLQVDQVILDRSPKPERYSNYAPGPELDSLLNRYRDEVEALRPQVRQTAAALTPFRPDHLELMATLDYVHRWLQGAGDPSPSKEAVLDRFTAVKGDKFPGEQIEQTYDRMAGQGFFGGAAVN